MNSSYIIRRLFQGVLVLLLLSILSFCIINAAPGDPAAALYGGQVDKLRREDRERINKNLGMDKPLLERYIIWGGNVLKGNLGKSYLEGREVSKIIMERLPNTLILSLTSLFLVIVIALRFGIKAGLNEGGIHDKMINYLGLGLYSIPTFYFALLMIIIFSINLKLLPSSGVTSIGGGGFLDRLIHLILPSFVIPATHSLAYAKFVKERVQEENSSLYSYAARVNGMGEKRVVRGAVKNALVPFVNYLGTTLSSFICGSIVIETLFSYSGIGQLSVKAALTKDYPLLMGTVLISGVVVVIGILITDIIALLLNPLLRKQVS